MNRFATALALQDASNISGVAHALVAACREAIDDRTTDRVNRDPAVQLIVYKLAALAGFEPLDWGFADDGYKASEATCKRRATETPVGARATLGELLAESDK